MTLPKSGPLEIEEHEMRCECEVMQQVAWLTCRRRIAFPHKTSIKLDKDHDQFGVGKTHFKTHKKVVRAIRVVGGISAGIAHMSLVAILDQHRVPRSVDSCNASDIAKSLIITAVINLYTCIKKWKGCCSSNGIEGMSHIRWTYHQSQCQRWL